MAFVPQPILRRPSQRALMRDGLERSASTCVKMSVVDRRSVLHLAVTSLVLAAPLPHSALAAMYSSDTTAPSYNTSGDPNKVETYMPQIQAGYDALVELQREWEAKTKNYDGDVVRRVLGTVGVKSPLFNIRKTFLKSWQIVSQTSPDFDLIDRLEEEWNGVLNGISSIDFQLYSVSFTELTENKDSLVKQGKKALDDTVSLYGDLLKDLKSTF